MSNRTSRFLFPYSRKATDPCSSDNTTCASLPNHSIIISKKENGLLQMMLSGNSHSLRKQQCTSLPETVTFAKEQTSFFDRFARNAAIRSSEWWHIQEKEEHRLCLSYQQRYTTLTSQRRSHIQKGRTLRERCVLPHLWVYDSHYPRQYAETDTRRKNINTLFKGLQSLAIKSTFAVFEVSLLYVKNHCIILCTGGRRDCVHL